MLYLLPLILTITLPACSLFTSEKTAPVPALQSLVTDLAHYKLNHASTLHEGDLLQHLMWTHYAATTLIEDQSPFAIGYPWTTRDKEILSLAAFLHDIGKGGRVDLFDGTHPTLIYQALRDDAGTIKTLTYTHDHEEHCAVGLAYLTTEYVQIREQRSYRQCNGIGYSFQTLFNQLNITTREQKIIAILVGIHYDFGKVVRGSMTQQQYLDRLQELATFVHYGPVDERLLRLAVLVQVADVMGITHVKARPTWLFAGAPEYAEVHCALIKAWDKFGYSSGKALAAWQALLREFKQEKKVQGAQHSSISVLP